MTTSLSEYLREKFDNVIKEVTTGAGGHVQEFSSQIILRDLITNGVSVYDSIDIIESILPKLKPRIHTDRISKLINQTLLEFGYSKEYFINGNIIDDTVVILENGDRTGLSYKFVKSFVLDLLKDFNVSSKSFRSIVEEYHRILRGLNANEITISTISQLKSLVFKNVLNIDPWNHSDTVSMYNELGKKKENFLRMRGMRSREEDHQVLLQIYQLAFNLLLLKYKYLPGLSVGNTIGQVEKLISQIHSSDTIDLSSKDIHSIGRMANLVDRFSRTHDPKLKNIIEEDLVQSLEDLVEIIKFLVNRGIIKWFFVISDGGIELFSTQNGKDLARVGLLVAAGMNGIEKLVEEITEYHPNLIKHEDGVIILEKRSGYSVVVLAKMESAVLQESIKEFCRLVDTFLPESMNNFKGEVTSLSEELMRYFRQAKLNYLFLDS